MHCAEDKFFLMTSLESSMWLIANLHNTLSNEQIQEVSDFINDITSIALTEQQCKDFFVLYPAARIYLAKLGIRDMGVILKIKAAISDFFAGCHWPTPGSVDENWFVSVLQEQARAMGYSLGAKIAK